MNAREQVRTRAEQLQSARRNPSVGDASADCGPGPDNPASSRARNDSPESASFGQLDPSVAIDLIGEILDALPADIGAALPDPLTTLHRYVRVANRLHATTAQVAAQANIDGMWALDGSGSLPSYMAAQMPIAHAAAKNYCTVGTHLRDHLPSTAQALRAGAMSWDAGRILSQVATASTERIKALADPIRIDDDDDEARDGELADGMTIDAHDDGDVPDGDSQTDDGGRTDDDEACSDRTVRCEDWLVEQASHMTVNQFRVLARTWAALADPDSDERGYRRSEKTRYAIVERTMDCYHIEGKLTPEGGKIISTALKAIIGVPSAEDKRTTFERNADALVAMARIVLEQDFYSAKVASRPTIVLGVNWSTFAAMAAAAGEPASQIQAMAGEMPGTWSDDRGPLPHSLLARMACDSQIARVVFGPNNEIINLGRINRVVSPTLRAAIVARDRNCIYPRCDAPPLLCDVHHLQRWTDGGPTDADNLALLCWRHHNHIHNSGIRVSREEPEVTPRARGGPVATPRLDGKTDRSRSRGLSEDGHRSRSGSAASFETSIQDELVETGPHYRFVDRHGNSIG